MIRIDMRAGCSLAVLWLVSAASLPVAAQTEPVGSGVLSGQPSRMSLDDDEAAMQTVRISLDNPDEPGQAARISLEDEPSPQQAARLRLDDSLLSSPLARMTLEDDQPISSRVRASLASDSFTAAVPGCVSCAAGHDTCGCAGPALPGQWAKVGYLMMWTKSSRIPALVTRSDAVDGGILGRPSTSVIFGDSEVDGGYRNGLRVNYGHRLEHYPNVAFELDYFSVFDDARSGDYYGTSNSGPVFARPYINATTGLEDARIIGAPGVSEGTVGVSNTSESHSFAVLLRQNLQQGPGGRIDLLSGYRHFRYRDGFYIHESRVTPIPGGTSYDGFDWFRSENEFHGGELGVHARFRRGTVSFDVLAKLALGAMRHDTLVDGRTTTTVPGAFPVTTYSAGGLLTAPTNMGRHTGSSFAVLPELGISATVPVTRCLSLQAGYSVLWLDDVFRAADLVDRTVNPTQLLGGTLAGPWRPAKQHTGSDFWMQGVNLMLVIEK